MAVGSDLIGHGDGEALGGVIVGPSNRDFGIAFAVFGSVVEEVEDTMQEQMVGEIDGDVAEDVEGIFFHPKAQFSIFGNGGLLIAGHFGKQGHDLFEAHDFEGRFDTAGLGERDEVVDGIGEEIGVAKVSPDLAKFRDIEVA